MSSPDLSTADALFGTEFLDLIMHWEVMGPFAGHQKYLGRSSEVTSTYSETSSKADWTFDLQVTRLQRAPASTFDLLLQTTGAEAYPFLCIPDILHLLDDHCMNFYWRDSMASIDNIIGCKIPSLLFGCFFGREAICDSHVPPHKIPYLILLSLHLCGCHRDMSIPIRY